MDTADSEVLDVTEGDPRSVNSPSAAHVPDLTTSVSEGSSEVESITRLRFHKVHAVKLLIRKTKADATDSKQVSTNRRKRIEHIKKKRDSK